MYCEVFLLFLLTLSKTRANSTSILKLFDNLLISQFLLSQVTSKRFLPNECTGDQMNATKLVLVGDACVGKTALCVAYANMFTSSWCEPNVFDDYKITVEVDGKPFSLMITSTSGLEDYDRLRPLSYPHTDVVVVVFSVVHPNSYYNVTKKWIPEVKFHMPKTPIVLVGNKTDQRNDPGCLKRLAEQKKKPTTTEMGKKLAREINAATYIECSCLDLRGVKNLFEKSHKLSLGIPVEFDYKTPSLNIFIMGDSYVGKTALRDAYLDKRFNNHYQPTSINYPYARSVIDGKQYIMNIWSAKVLDEKLICNAIIVVFSVNDLQSYHNVLTKWTPQLKQQCPSAPIILVGNKTDLREKKIKTVTTEMGKQLALEINAVTYFECSCRDGRTATIEQIFETAARASYFVKVEKFLMKSNKTLFKVHLVGDANVGKSCLQNRFQTNERLNEFNQHLNVVDQSFNERWHPHYNFAGFTEMDGEECGWIICNGLSDRKITKRADQYLLKKDRGIDVFMLMFSVVHFNSYLSIEKKWIPELQKLKHYNPKIPIVLVGNKTDLRSKAKPHISADVGEWLGRKINAAKYLECSAFESEEVEKIFVETAWASIRYAEERRQPKSQWFKRLFVQKRF